MITLKKGNCEIHFYQDENGKCMINTDGHFWHWINVTKDEGNSIYKEYLNLGYERI